MTERRRSATGGASDDGECAGAPSATPTLTHFDAAGRAHMVDVGDKPATRRRAVACGWIHMQPATAERIRNGAAAKGDVLGVARIAGIMAAKRTGEWIPLCHPLGLTHVAIDFDVHDAAVRAEAVCEVTGPTGVEMEAMTAVSAALLTIYDMCKAVDRGMRIEGLQLLEKSGGRSGYWRAEAPSPEPPMGPSPKGRTGTAPGASPGRDCD